MSNESVPESAFPQDRVLQIGIILENFGEAVLSDGKLPISPEPWIARLRAIFPFDATSSDREWSLEEAMLRSGPLGDQLSRSGLRWRLQLDDGNGSTFERVSEEPPRRAPRR